MIKIKTILNTSVFIVSSLLATQAYAKSWFPGLQPANYNGAITCGSCHSGVPETESNVGTPYGRTFSIYVDHHTLSPASYQSIEGYDSDGDGFSNIQEIVGGSSFNTPSSVPMLSGTGLMTFGTVSVLPALNETITTLTSVPSSPNGLIVPAGQKNIGGTVDYSMSNFVGNGTATLMFSTGGVQAGATAYFAGNAAPVAMASTINPVGSISITIADDGPYDTYSQAAYINTAINRISPISSANGFDIYTGVDPYARISPLAIIDPYAIIDAYAIVDSYAYIGAGVEVYSYAYIAPYVDVYANVDPYVEVSATVAAGSPALLPLPGSFANVIKTKVAIVTPTPLIPSGGGNGEGGGSTGGLHCMTSGIGLQGLFFFGLISLGLLFRRRKI